MRLISVLLSCLLVALIVGCGSSPGDAPELPDPEVWTGELIIEGSVEVDSATVIQPDSIGVVIDDEDLGYLTNPVVMPEVPEGRYDISTYYDLNDLRYIGPIKRVFVGYNQTATLEIEATSAGVLIVKVGNTDAIFDSISVKLDGVEIGKNTHPWEIEGVTAGIHKLVVSAVFNGEDYEGWMSDIEIKAAEETEVDFTLQPVAPTVGSHAPDIGVIDLDGVSHSLSDHWGEVIYLYFFEYT